MQLPLRRDVRCGVRVIRPGLVGITRVGPLADLRRKLFACCDLRRIGSVGGATLWAVVRRYNAHEVPLEMGSLVGWLLYLAGSRQHNAPRAYGKSFSALLFLYREVLERDFGWLDDVVRAKKPKRLPIVFTPEEAMAVIEELQDVR